MNLHFRLIFAEDDADDAGTGDSVGTDTAPEPIQVPIVAPVVEELASDELLQGEELLVERPRTSSRSKSIDASNAAALVEVCISYTSVAIVSYIVFLLYCICFRYSTEKVRTMISVWLQIAREG